MKVNSNQPSSRTTDITDGTSNTMMVGEQAKPEKPFAKDSFESLSIPTLDGSSKQPALRGDATSLKAQDCVDLKDKKDAGESLNVKYTLFLPE